MNGVKRLANMAWVILLVTVAGMALFCLAFSIKEEMSYGGAVEVVWQRIQVHPMPIAFLPVSISVTMFLLLQMIRPPSAATVMSGAPTVVTGAALKNHWDMQLDLIWSAAHLERLSVPGPRTCAWLWLGAVVAITAAATGKYGAFAEHGVSVLGAWIGAGVVVWIIPGGNRSWISSIASRLALYEPAEKAALAGLQQSTASSGSLDPVAVLRWVVQERTALLTTGREGLEGEAGRDEAVQSFVNRDI